MQKTIENLWFKPYTPIFFLAIFIAFIYHFVYPAVKRALEPVPITPKVIQPTPSPQVLGASPGSILEKVGQLIMLPNDETPQVINITDVERFKNQPFFKNAKNGDVLIIYAKNKKAILFDPKENIVIDTAPIAAGTESATSSPSTTPRQPTPTTPIFATPSATP